MRSTTHNKLLLVARLTMFPVLSSAAAGCLASGEQLAEGGDATEVAEVEVGELDEALVLETTYDQCSGQLSVLDTNGIRQSIPRGVWRTVNVTPRFSWYCGSTRESTTCAPSTRYVRVYHSTQNREITWKCSY